MLKDVRGCWLDKRFWSIKEGRADKVRNDDEDNEEGGYKRMLKMALADYSNWLIFIHLVKSPMTFGI